MWEGTCKKECRIPQRDENDHAQQIDKQYIQADFCNLGNHFTLKVIRGSACCYWQQVFRGILGLLFLRFRLQEVESGNFGP